MRNDPKEFRSMQSVDQLSPLSQRVGAGTFTLSQIVMLLCICKVTLARARKYALRHDVS